MAEKISPRQILKDLLQGNAVARPLFVPIVFGLGARLENLPSRSFLSNPTKISNALRQIHAHLRSDGVSCYFDPFLEAEALGGTLEWLPGREPPVLKWPSARRPGELPTDPHSPEDVLKKGRIPVALEVIGRLKTLLHDDSLLMVGVRGPLALAAELIGSDGTSGRQPEEIPESALEVASAAAAGVSKAFAEAGASLIFFREDAPPKRTKSCESWASALLPMFNVIRFYGALPVLQITNSDALVEKAEVVTGLTQFCIVCFTSEVISRVPMALFSGTRPGALGISLPVSGFRQDQPSDPRIATELPELISRLRPGVVTTEDDVPPGMDLKRLTVLLQVIRGRTGG